MIPKEISGTDAIWGLGAEERDTLDPEKLAYSQILWLKEIALQLAIKNEREAERRKIRVTPEPPEAPPELPEGMADKLQGPWFGGYPRLNRFGTPLLSSCAECGEIAGSQHRPSCHRQGIVTNASDYSAQEANVSLPNDSDHERSSVLSDLDRIEALCSGQFDVMSLIADVRAWITRE